LVVLYLVPFELGQDNVADAVGDIVAEVDVVDVAETVLDVGETVEEELLKDRTAPQTAPLLVPEVNVLCM